MKFATLISCFTLLGAAAAAPAESALSARDDGPTYGGSTLSCDKSSMKSNECGILFTGKHIAWSATTSVMHSHSWETMEVYSNSCEKLGTLDKPNFKSPQTLKTDKLKESVTVESLMYVSADIKFDYGKKYHNESKAKQAILKGKGKGFLGNQYKKTVWYVFPCK